MRQVSVGTVTYLVGTHREAVEIKKWAEKIEFYTGGRMAETIDESDEDEIWLGMTMPYSTQKDRQHYAYMAKESLKREYMSEAGRMIDFISKFGYTFESKYNYLLRSMGHIAPDGDEKWKYVIYEDINDRDGFFLFGNGKLKMLKETVERIKDSFNLEFWKHYG